MVPVSVLNCPEPLRDVDKHVEVRTGMGLDASAGTWRDQVGVELSPGEVEFPYGARAVGGSRCGQSVDVADEPRQIAVDEAGDPDQPRPSRRPGGIGPARFEVLPVVGAGVIAVEFLTQMFRIVTVDEHERFADGESVEPGEDQGVSLRLGYLAHVQSCVASGSPVSGSAAEPCKFVDSSIPPSYYYEYILCKFLTCDLCDRPAVCGCEGPCLRGGMPGGLHL